MTSRSSAPAPESAPPRPRYVFGRPVTRDLPADHELDGTDLA